MAIWYYAVAEAKHEIQNPSTPAKVLAAAHAANLGPGSRVLDLAGGKGGPAALLTELGCRVTLVERSPEFAAVARGRGLEVIEGDAAAYEFEPEGYDAVVCLGASFVWGGLDGTIDALLPAARPGGHLVLGEPYWRSLPLPPDYPDGEQGFTTLADTVEKIGSRGLSLVGIAAASEDDWDNYESLHWQGVEEWAASNPDHPDRREILSRHREWRDRYLRWERQLLGWAIFVARKP